ncbi:neuromedin-S [Myotis yumanensis]|uniref:neuromedin-S n=1 Tax=Myotis yumanensis TaxID=159337 RepID=UPI0038D4D169
MKTNYTPGNYRDTGGRIASHQVSSQNTGYIQPLDDSPDGLDIVQLERLAYWATLSRPPKDNQDIYKRFLFDYSRTREPTQPVKTGFPPARPVTRLATKLANGKMKRFLQRDPGAVALDFTKKDHAATWRRPFFLFRPRNGRNTERPVG